MIRSWKFWVGLALGLIFMIAVARAETFRRYDYWGNRYPDDCMRDMRYLEPMIDYHFSEYLGYTENGLRTLGTFYAPERYDPRHRVSIYIDNRFTNADLREEAIRHELCHYQYWLNHKGNADWHPIRE